MAFLGARGGGNHVPVIRPASGHPAPCNPPTIRQKSSSTVKLSSGGKNIHRVCWTTRSPQCGREPMLVDCRRGPSKAGTIGQWGSSRLSSDEYEKIISHGAGSLATGHRASHAPRGCKATEDGPRCPVPRGNAKQTPPTHRFVASCPRPNVILGPDSLGSTWPHLDRVLG